MGPSPTYHPHEGEECETSVEHGLPVWAEPAAGYCSRPPCPSPMWGSRFVGPREVGPWVGEQKPLGKTPLGGNRSPEMTYLPTYLQDCFHVDPSRPVDRTSRARVLGVNSTSPKAQARSCTGATEEAAKAGA